jgi:hypothetical protein
MNNQPWLVINRLRSIVITFIGLPSDVRFAIKRWNGMTHGNITFVIVLLVARYAMYLSFQSAPFILLMLGWLGLWASDADDTS